MFFAAAARAPACCIPPPIDEGWKLHLMNTAKVPLRQPLHAAKIHLTVSAIASLVTIYEICRFLFFCNRALKRDEQICRWYIHLLNHKRWLKRTSIKCSLQKSLILQKQYSFVILNCYDM